ncbi:MAG: hypothetical protein KDK00_07740 [Rhodobacteraceae bacterium]|nr:hypothetical protein [Paracoccaceae bacterium]
MTGIGTISKSPGRAAFRCHLFAALAGLLRGLVLLAVLPSAATAQDLPEGANDPAYRAALDLWLDDDEATALPALAGMAAEGNEAARLLVGLIDKSFPLQGPWLALRDKPERIALLRAAGGLSGRSWLRMVDHDLAHRWLAVLDQRADIAAALSLADLGEARAVRVALVSLEARQVTGFDAFADDSRFPAALNYLIWQDWRKAGRAVAPALADLHPGDGQRQMVQASVAPDDLMDWLAITDLGPPLTALCRDACPDSEATCRLAGYEAIGGYRRFAGLGSPAVMLIGEARFAASRRGQASVLRRALAYDLLTSLRVDAIAGTDACFAALLAAEGQRF